MPSGATATTARLTLAEVAAELGVSANRVRSIIRCGDLAAVRGRSLTVSREDLDDYLRRTAEWAAVDAALAAVAPPIKEVSPTVEVLTAERLWRRGGYLTVAEAAVELGISEWSVTYRIRRGDLTGTRRTSRGKILISRGDLDEYRDRFGMSAANAPDSLSVREAAAALGLGRSTVSQLIREGTLPAARTGSGKTAAYRIGRTDLDEYRRSRHVEPDMLSVAEAAAAIGSSENTLRHALCAGRLRGVLVGSRRYVRRADLDEYAACGAGQYERTVTGRARRHKADLDALHTEGFLTLSDVAETAEVTRTTVHRWIAAGKLRSEKRGQLRGVRPEWIDEMRSR